MANPPQHSVGDIDAFVRELNAALSRSERSRGQALDRVALAREVPISVQSLYAYLNGTTIPPNDVFERLLDVLGIAGAERGRLATARDNADSARRARRRARSAGRADTAGRPPRQLPADTPHFVGRREELHRLNGMLDGPPHPGTVPIYVLCGGPGVGKTALALRWAHAVADRFADGQLYVNLRGFDPGDRPVPVVQALRALLGALGAEPGSVPGDLDACSALYRGTLAGRRILVVVDNARDADHVRPLLPADPGCALVVTSRGPLPSLVAREGARSITVSTLDDDEAAALLALHVGADRLAAEPAAVASIVERCVGLPLALTIVATRVSLLPDLSLSELAAALDDQGTRLDVLDAGDPLTDVRSVFAWSYRRLADAGARLFRLMAVHPGPDLGIAAVADLAGLSGSAARGALNELVRTSLVQRSATDRYSFHDLLRTYARELVDRTETDADRRAAVARLGDGYAATAAAAMDLIAPHERHRRPSAIRPPAQAPPFVDAGSALRWLDDERANLVAIAPMVGWYPYPVVISQLIYRYLITGGHHGEAETVHANAVRSARGHGDAAGESAALRSLGGSLWLSGRADEAVDRLEASLAISARLTDVEGLARTHNTLGLVFQSRGDQAAAQDQLQRSIIAFRQVGDLAGEGDAQGNLGIVYWGWGRYQEAIDQFGQLRDTAEAMADREGVAIATGNLGNVHERLGRYQEALDHHRAALAVYIETGNRAGHASALTNLGVVHGRLGQPAEAIVHFEQALRRYTELGDAEHEAEVGVNIVLALLELGRVAEAGDRLSRSLRTVGLDDRFPATVHRRLGDALRQLGRTGDARARYELALTQARAAEDRYEEAHAANGLAQILPAGGAVDADQLGRTALRLFTELGVPEAELVRQRLGNP
jgi:tetratricopeptide (TPR) repeat protein